jgi:hypothetical protein
MARLEKRFAAEAAYLVRNLISEGLLEALARAEARRSVEASLGEDRERERELDREVDALLRLNAQAIRTSGADYAEMFRKAKKMLAAKKKIPL